MYRDDDPFLAEVRGVCLALPETVEVEAWGRPTFRAGKKMFAVFTGSLEDRFSLLFKPEPDERPALIAEERFYLPPYLGPGGWLGLDLVSAPVDWAEVAELIESSYRQVALKRMLTALTHRERPSAT
jgi:predicted DNA-binding protein (MmcQ/YjbR family)